jgi:hypothetical protein
LARRAAQHSGRKYRLTPQAVDGRSNRRRFSDELGAPIRGLARTDANAELSGRERPPGLDIEDGRSLSSNLTAAKTPRIQAGHMKATVRTASAPKTLAQRGRPHMNQNEILASIDFVHAA